MKTIRRAPCLDWIVSLLAMTACSTGDALLGRGDSSDSSLAFEAGPADANAATMIDAITQETAIAVSVGLDSACALTAIGGVRCWGNNQSGQLGNNMTQGSDGPAGSAVPVSVTGLASGVKAISVGDSSACALTAIGGVLCWGDNRYGQLGNGSMGYSTVPVPVAGLTSGVIAVSVGYDTVFGHGSACALTAGGGVLCWGEVTADQLGNSSAVPVPVTGLQSGVTAVAVGNSYACALTVGGGVQCWGTNWNGQLGNNSISAFSAVPVPVPGLTSVTALSAGNSACALAVGGQVKCWGPIARGLFAMGVPPQLHYGPSGPVAVAGLSSGVTAVSAGAGTSFACALTGGGGVECWGSAPSPRDAYPPAPVSGLESGVTAVSVGSSSACALMAGGGVQCWGDNSTGQLGNGSSWQGSWDPVPVAGFAGAGKVVPSSEASDANPRPEGDASDFRDAATTGCADPLTFADPDVENFVRQAIGAPSGPIHAADVTGIIDLNLLFANSPAYDASPANIDYVSPPRLDNVVTSLGGVECIPSLRTIELNPYQVDLAPVGRLPNLTALAFGPTSESAFPSLPHVTSLVAQVFSNTAELLSACPSLKALWLYKPDFSTAEARAALSALTGLTLLSAPAANLTDATPLGPLSRLTDVDLSWNQIRDISSLSALPNLRSLDLSHNQITDLAPLVEDVGIGYGTSLAINGNPIDCVAQQQNIATLRARSVSLLTDCP